MGELAVSEVLKVKGYVTVPVLARDDSAFAQEWMVHVLRALHSPLHHILVRAGEGDVPLGVVNRHCAGDRSEVH